MIMHTIHIQKAILNLRFIPSILGWLWFWICSTITVMTSLVALSFYGASQLKFHWVERYDKLLVGSVLCVVGILTLVFHDHDHDHHGHGGSIGDNLHRKIIVLWRIYLILYCPADTYFFYLVGNFKTDFWILYYMHQVGLKVSFLFAFVAILSHLRIFSMYD